MFRARKRYKKSFSLPIRILFAMLVGLLLCSGIYAVAAEGDSYTVTIVNGNGSTEDGDGYVFSVYYDLVEDENGNLQNGSDQWTMPSRVNSNYIFGWRIMDNAEIPNEISFLRELNTPFTAADFNYTPGAYTIYAMWNHTLTAEYYSGVNDAYSLVDGTWSMGEAVQRTYIGECAADSSESDTITYTLPWAYRDKYCLVGWYDADDPDTILPVGQAYTIDAGTWSDLNAVRQYYAYWEKAADVSAVIDPNGGTLSSEPNFFGGTSRYWAYSESYGSDSKTVYTVYAPSEEDGTVQVLLPQASLDGSAFAGWSYGGKVYQAGTTVEISLNGSENVFTAKWTEAGTSTSSASSAQSSDANEADSITVRYVIDGITDEALTETIKEDSTADAVTVRLPAAQSKSGYYWGGWLCDIDGKIYQANSKAVFSSSELGADITFTALLSPQILSGAQELESDTQYYLPIGTWTVNNDETVYSGKQYFYVDEDGEYDFGRN